MPIWMIVSLCISVVPADGGLSAAESAADAAPQYDQQPEQRFEVLEPEIAVAQRTPNEEPIEGTPVAAFWFIETP